MALDGVINFGKVTCSTGYTSAATSVVLSSGHGAKLPDPAIVNYNLVWFDSSSYADPADDPNVEIVRVTAKSTDTLTIVRAQEGTTATNKNTSAKTYRMLLSLTAKMITDIDLITSRTTKSITAATYTVLNTDRLVKCDCTAQAITITLPTAVGIDGKMFVIKKTDTTSNIVTIVTTSSQTIDGGTSLVMYDANDAYSLFSDNANYFIG